VDDFLVVLVGAAVAAVTANVLVLMMRSWFSKRFRNFRNWSNVPSSWSLMASS